MNLYEPIWLILRDYQGQRIACYPVLIYAVYLPPLGSLCLRLFNYLKRRLYENTH